MIFSDHQLLFDRLLGGRAFWHITTAIAGQLVHSLRLQKRRTPDGASPLYSADALEQIDIIGTIIRRPPARLTGLIWVKRFPENAQHAAARRSMATADGAEGSPIMDMRNAADDINRHLREMPDCWTTAFNT